MKETFYKEEIKKYNERQIELEGERQKLYTELSVMRDAVNDKDRQLSQQSKDSEQGWLDERYRLNKKLEQLKTEL